MNIFSEWTTWHYVYVFWLTFCANLALHNFKTLQKQESIIFGSTSHGITFMFTANGGEEHKLQILVTIKDDKIYTIIYGSLSDTFDVYLPILNHPYHC